jgi:AraC-like DNA-binding protein
MDQVKSLQGKDFFNSTCTPICVIRRNPQPEFPLHTHDFSEIFIVLSGTGTHYTERTNFSLSGGDVFVINRDQPHGFKDIDSLCLVNILFSMKDLNLPEFDISESAGFHSLFTIEPALRETERVSSYLHLSPSSMSETLTHIERLEKELSGKTELSQFVAVGIFMQLVGCLSRSYSSSPRSDIEDLYQLGQVICFMEKNLHRSISVQELLDIAHMSESTLLRAFKKVLGVSPIQYHLSKRIEKTCSQLAHTDRSVTMIAYDWGFEDSNYYARQFRKFKNLSPLEYRRNYNPMSGDLVLKNELKVMVR